VHPHLTHAFLGQPHALSIPNCISIGSTVFAQLTAERPYTLQWTAPFPSKLPLRMVPLAHRSPQPKRHLDRFSCFRAHDRDRPTDHSKLSVTVGRIYVVLRCRLKSRGRQTKTCIDAVNENLANLSSIQEEVDLLNDRQKWRSFVTQPIVRFMNMLAFSYCVPCDS